MPERLKGTDCKSVGNAYDGSNPSRPTTLFTRRYMNTKLSLWICLAVHLLVIVGCPSSHNPIPLPIPEPEIIVVTPVIGAGPVVITNTDQCSNETFIQLECWLHGDYGESVYCQTPCGDIVCIPNDKLICPDSTCYNADP